MRTLINKIKLVWGKISNIFNKKVMKFDFKYFDVEEIEKEID